MYFPHLAMKLGGLLTAMALNYCYEGKVVRRHLLICSLLSK